MNYSSDENAQRRHGAGSGFFRLTSSRCVRGDEGAETYRYASKRVKQAADTNARGGAGRRGGSSAGAGAV